MPAQAHDHFPKIGKHRSARLLGDMCDVDDARGALACDMRWRLRVSHFEAVSIAPAFEGFVIAPITHSTEVCDNHSWLGL